MREPGPSYPNSLASRMNNIIGGVKEKVKKSLTENTSDLATKNQRVRVGSGLKGSAIMKKDPNYRVNKRAAVREGVKKTIRDFTGIAKNK